MNLPAAAQDDQQAENVPLDRRKVLAILAGLGVGTAVFQRALAAQVEVAGQITPLMVQQAEWVAGIELTEDDRQGDCAFDRSCPEEIQGFA